MSHIELLNVELFEIKKDITPNDKIKCSTELKKHRNTISAYLNNKATDAELATNMLAFFHEQIAKREAILKKCA